MSRDETRKPEGGNVRHAGREEHSNEAEAEVGGESKSATCQLVDMVTEATWEEALRQLGGLPSNPLPLWTMLATRILRAVADGERDPLCLKRFALEGLNDQDGSGKDY
jgi:hypothetical protein